MDRVNLFNPFSSPEYENRLTWAFLVFLKYDLSLQNFLRELVESRLFPKYQEHSETSWESANISTQTKWIESSTDLLVSVLLTDISIQDEIKVERSDREAIYDGVIEYPNGLTLIIENKPSHRDVDKKQLSPSRNSFSSDIDQVVLHDSAICLEWAEVLEGVLEYADSDHASFGSRKIAHDFLSFVQNVHPELTPYRTFKLCGDRQEALQRRTSGLLDVLASEINLESRGWYLFRPSKIAERIMIQVESGKLKVELAPADTVGQARCFFETVNKEAFLALQASDDWKVRPNLHFSFANKHLIWAEETTWETREYFDRFSDGSLYGKRDRDKLLRLVKQWEREHLISSADREKIEAEFNNTKRQSLNVVPGFLVSREWDLDTVIELEDREELEECIIDALVAPLATWRETL